MRLRMDALEKQLKFILRQKLYIADSDKFLSEEIYNNCFGLFVTQQERTEINIDKILNILKMIRDNRKNQLNKTSKNINLIYYSWVDEQNEQLRFNFINATHKKLPFGCEILTATDEREIVEDYIASLDRHLLDFDALEDIFMSDSEKHSPKIILKVYSEYIMDDEKRKN